MKTSLVVAVAALLGCSGTTGESGSSDPATAANTGAPATASDAPEAASTAAPATGQPAAGTSVIATNDNYVIEAAVQGTATANQEGEVEIRLVPRNGYHVNQEYPIRLTVTPPSGVTLPRSEFDKAAAKEFGDPRAVFGVRFTPSAAGEQAFTASFRFSVCNPQTCLLPQENLRWSVTAQ
jgi:hypothetical protein